MAMGEKKDWQFMRANKRPLALATLAAAGTDRIGKAD
jgi:hypothetical protein